MDNLRLMDIIIVGYIKFLNYEIYLRIEKSRLKI